MSIVSEPIFEKRSTIFIRCERSLPISSTATGSTGWLRRYSNHPSSEEVGVPNWCAVSLGQTDPHAVLLVLLGGREGDVGKYGEYDYYQQLHVGK